MRVTGVQPAGVISSREERKPVPFAAGELCGTLLPDIIPAFAFLIALGLRRYHSGQPIFAATVAARVMSRSA